MSWKIPFKDKEQYANDVRTTLRAYDYGPELDEHHIQLIVDLIANQEEWELPNVLAIRYMYEVLGWQKYNEYTDPDA